MNKNLLQYIPAGNISLIGCGMRTNDEGIRQMLEADAFGHDTVVVVRDHKFWQMQMHLDTHFNIIDGYGAAHCMTQVLQREKYDPTPTGINAVRFYDPADGKAYRLDGTPATPATRGIVVEDGKLKVVKQASLLSFAES